MTKLIALGGWSGAGKTTLGYSMRRAVPAFSGALVLDNDQVRRDLLGYDIRAIMPEESYTPEVTQRVRERLDAMTREALGQGRDVIDTSGFWGEAARAQVEALATACGAAFKGIWLDVPQPVLEDRIAHRMAERERLPALSGERGHASDADLGIFVKYAGLQPPAAGFGWQVIDAAETESETLQLLVATI